jgi:hypothetical protein
LASSGCAGAVTLWIPPNWTNWLDVLAYAWTVQRLIPIVLTHRVGWRPYGGNNPKRPLNTKVMVAQR